MLSRPELLGTASAVCSTHWLASAAGMAMLDRGGKAFDAATAAALVATCPTPRWSGACASWRDDDAHGRA